MSSKSSDPQGDFNALARQYWDAMSQIAGGSGQTSGELPGIRQGMEWWSKLLPRGNQQLDETIERMTSQGGAWFGAMQQLSEQLAGQSAGPSEIAERWKSMLSAGGVNPVADMFARMSGGDSHSFDAWATQSAPLLALMKGEAATMLNLPTFGLAREHQERVQRLARAQVQYQERVSDYSAQLARAGKLAFARFETKLSERSEPGRQLDSARALFDLWIDAAEEAWAEVAISPEYRSVYGEFVNAQMQLRGALQTEIEQVAASLGLPTRSEMNGSHRKLAALEREVRSLQRQLRTRAPGPDASRGSNAKHPGPDAADSKQTTRRPASKPAPGAARKKKPAAGKKARPVAAATSRAASKSTSKTPSRSRSKGVRAEVRTAPARGGRTLPKVALPNAVASPSGKRSPAATGGVLNRGSRKR